MAAEPRPTPSPTVHITAADARHAEVTLAGDLRSGALRELEERLADPRLYEATEWVLDMSGVDGFDLACAYALLRAATERPENAALTIRGAPHGVQRTLRDAGLDAVAVIQA